MLDAGATDSAPPSNPTGRRPRLSLRGPGVGKHAWRWIVAVGSLSLVAWSVFFRHPVHDPVVEGRRVSSWFRESIRSSGRPDRQDDDALRRQAARLVLFRAGTNAVPYLVDVVLRQPPESTLHRTLRGLSGHLHGVLGLGAFADPERVRSEARGLLTRLRAPAELVEKLVRPELSGPEPNSVRALVLLSDTVGAPAVVQPWIRRALTGNTSARRAAMYLNTQRELPAGFPPPLTRLPEPTDPDIHSLTVLFGRYGPEARAAIPWLERCLGETKNGVAGATPGTGAQMTAVAAALALLEIQPDHSEALEHLQAVGRSMRFNTWNALMSSSASMLCVAARGPRTRITHPASIAVIEGLAREEMAGWRLRGLSHVVLNTLEHVAPDRAVPLYRDQMLSTNRPNIRIVAAGRLLRLRRTDAEPVRFLSGWLTNAVDHLARMAAEQLGEADPSVAAAADALKAIARDGPPWIASMARISLGRIEDRRHARDPELSDD